MSFYSERYQNHPVHNNISNLRERIDGLLASNKHPINFEHLLRLQEVVSSLIHLFDNIDETFASINALNKFDQTVANINSDLNNFDNTSDGKHLEQANTKVDNLVAIANQIMPPKLPKDYGDIIKTKNDFLTSALAALDKINQRKKLLLNDIDKMSDKVSGIVNTVEEQKRTIDSQKNRLDSAIAEYQKQFSESEDRRRDSFDDSMAEQNKKIDKFLHITEEKTEAFLQEKRTETDNAIKENRVNLEKMSGELIENNKILLEDYIKESIKLVRELKVYHEQAKRLLDIIGNTGFASNYKITANSERKTANMFRWIAIGLMLAGVGCIVWIAISLAENGINWNYLFARIGASIVLFIPAFYAAKQSSWHRINELHNKKMELELASIGPFLELLPEEKKFELKAKLTEKLFAQPQGISITDDGVSPKSLLDILGKVVDNLTKK